MNIRLIQVGKTEDGYLQEGIEKFTRRIQFYCSFETITLPGARYKTEPLEKILQHEADAILNRVGQGAYFVLLDERGKDYSSIEFSQFIQDFAPLGAKSFVSKLTFVIGGPFGFDQRVYAASQQTISLSKMTFSHQMIRLFFVEQLYRAWTIWKKEPYHHG